MRNAVVLAVAAVFFAGAAVTGVTPARAQKEDPLVAKVNGSEIRTSDIKIAAEDLIAQLTGVPAEQRYRFLVEYLIERYLIVQAAEKAKTAETDEFKTRLRYYAAKALRDAYFMTNIENQVSAADVRKVYEKEVGQIKPETEIRARQIFVKTEREAKEVHALLSQGQDFAELAKKRSVSPTAANGGDLGFFTKAKVEPAFAEVAFKLKKGEVSQPFKVKYGWQILKLEDSRKRELQPFEKVEPGIRTILVRGKVSETVDELRKKAKIEYIDPDAKPAPVSSGNKSSKQN